MEWQLDIAKQDLETIVMNALFGNIGCIVASDNTSKVYVISKEQYGLLAQKHFERSKRERKERSPRRRDYMYDGQERFYESMGNRDYYNRDIR